MTCEERGGNVWDDSQETDGGGRGRTWRKTWGEDEFKLTSLHGETSGDGCCTSAHHLPVAMETDSQSAARREAPASACVASIWRSVCKQYNDRWRLRYDTRSGTWWDVREQEKKEKGAKGK